MKKQAYNGLVAASLAALVLVSGCGGQAPGQGPTEVNSYKITATDTNVQESFNGTVLAQNSIVIRANVSGRVVEKYVKGGDTVKAGQALYRLDGRQYEANLASAQALSLIHI